MSVWLFVCVFVCGWGLSILTVIVWPSIVTVADSFAVVFAVIVTVPIEISPDVCSPSVTLYELDPPELECGGTALKLAGTS